MTGAEAVLERLRTFTRKVEPKLNKELKKEIFKILNDYTVITTQVSREVDRTSIKGCCEALAVLKKLHLHNLPPKNLAAYYEEGWSASEVAWLYNATLNQVVVKQRSLKDLPKGQDPTNFDLPPWLSGKRPEDLTDEEVATIARLMMVKEASAGNLDAAQKLMSNFNSGIKAEMKKKWEEIKKIDYFYMSVFLNELIKSCKMADPTPGMKSEIRELKAILEGQGAGEKSTEIITRLETLCEKGRIDVKGIFRKILTDLEDDVKGVAEEALANLGKHKAREVSRDELAAQEAKLLRRGKWKKRKSWLSAQPNPGEEDNAPGAMVVAEESAKEVTPASQEGEAEKEEPRKGEAKQQAEKVDWGAI